MPGFSLALQPASAMLIMVTMPSEAATDPMLVHQLLASGMDVMRINCAHDGPDVWLAMIHNVRAAEKELGRPCKVYADLAGPKLRTGEIEPEGRLIKIKPKRNLRGQVIIPAQVQLINSETVQDSASLRTDALPLPNRLLQQLKSKDQLALTDTRQRKRRLHAEQHSDGSWWATTDRTCYIETGTKIRLLREEELIDECEVGLLPVISKPIH